MPVGIRFEVPPPVLLPAGLGWQQFCDGWSVGLGLQTSTELDLCQFNKFGGDSSDQFGVPKPVEFQTATNVPLDPFDFVVFVKEVDHRTGSLDHRYQFLYQVYHLLLDCTIVLILLSNWR